MLFWAEALLLSIAIAWSARHFALLGTLSSTDLKALCATTASVGGTMLGFILAALAILATVAGTRLLRNMQKTGHLSHLLHRMLGSIVAFAVLTVVSLASMFFAEPSSEIIFALLGLSVLSFLTLGDVIRKLWIVMNNLYP